MGGHPARAWALSPGELLSRVPVSCILMPHLATVGEMPVAQAAGRQPSLGQTGSQLRASSHGLGSDRKSKASLLGAA